MGKKLASCALTGHRKIEKDFTSEMLRKQLYDLVERGVTTFYCGMAIGFDLLCAREILEIKKYFPVRLVACIPCADQSNKFSPYWRNAYNLVLRNADEKVVLNPVYRTGCMFERNRYMVDRADILYAYCNDNKGGSAYTVAYAQQKGIPVLHYGAELAL